MSEFYDYLDELLGEGDALSDVRVVARRLWFYDFAGSPLRLWDGKGKLFTSDGKEWLGSIDANNFNHHQTPALQDGRDGSSASYTLGLTLRDIPGASARSLYEQIKTNQSLAAGRNITVYLAIFQEGEGLRPSIPIVYFKELRMMAPKFSETLEADQDGTLIQRYKVSITAKDNNFGRSNVPNGTYADTIQKQRALELGVTVDRGSEYLAILANKTFQLPS